MHNLKTKSTPQVLSPLRVGKNAKNMAVFTHSSSHYVGSYPACKASCQQAKYDNIISLLFQPRTAASSFFQRCSTRYQTDEEHTQPETEHLGKTPSVCLGLDDPNI